MDKKFNCKGNKKMKPVKFGSVCSGIEAASVAWNGLGWGASWFSEIEPFPSAVLKHHYSDVKNLGDMTLLESKILNQEIEAPEVFCGGTPCQAFSIAGLRQSLDDARGNLSLTFIKIANAIDTIRRSRNEHESIIFWENVPGVLSTADNAFGYFLAGLAGESEQLKPAGKRWPNAGIVFGPKRVIAWRVLDAQYFGLAQRRKRVFVVASARNGFDPTAVLFERESLQRNIAPSREKGENFASFTPGSIGGYSEGVGTIRANGGDVGGGSETLCVFNQNEKKRVSLFENHGTDSRIKPVEVCPTMTSRWGTGGGNVPIALASGQANAEILINQSTALTCLHEAPIVFHPTQDPISNDNNISHALTAGSSKGQASIAIALAENTIGRKPENGGNGNGFTVGGPMYTLNCTGVHGVAHSMQVRRLTPIECERLQGFPDNYTAIAWRNKDALNCPDGPRYKALGNSWAIPVIKWIGERIQKELNKKELKK
jgi:DNA (cytosine-5)-methyltransferase 1